MFGILVADIHKESLMHKGAHGVFRFSLRQMQGYCLVTKGSCADMLGFSHIGGSAKALRVVGS